MHQFWFDLLTTMTFVAVTSSIELVLDNTAEKANWNWIIKEPQLPPRASGVSLNASSFNIMYCPYFFFSLYMQGRKPPRPLITQVLIAASRKVVLQKCNSVHDNVERYYG